MNIETHTSGGRAMKERLAKGEQSRGVLVRMPSEDLVEMAGIAGMDHVVLDCEHGAADVIPLRRHIMAAQLHGMDSLVRVGENEPALIQRALDQGATGVIVPHVDDAHGARAAVAHVHYPPLGNRGFATYTRAGSYGAVGGADHLRRRGEETMLIVMIESAEGVRNAAEILAVDGVDGVLVGPADLAVSMGLAGDSAAEPVRLAQGEVNARVAEASRVRMDIVGSLEQARTAIDEGTAMVVYNLTHLLTKLLSTLASYPHRR